MSSTEGHLFDCDAAAKALDRPRFRYRGEVYEGRVVSLPEALRFTAQLQNLGAGGEIDVEEMLSTMERVVENMEFVSEGGEELDASDWLSDVPGPVAREALMDFLGSMLEATENGSRPTRS